MNKSTINVYCKLNWMHELQYQKYCKSKGLYLIISDNSFWFEMSGELDKVPDVDIDEGVFKYVYIRVYEDDGGDGRCRTQ